MLANLHDDFDDEVEKAPNSNWNPKLAALLCFHESGDCDLCLVRMNRTRHEAPTLHTSPNFIEFLIMIVGTPDTYAEAVAGLAIHHSSP